MSAVGWNKKFVIQAYSSGIDALCFLIKEESFEEESEEDVSDNNESKEVSEGEDAGRERVQDEKEVEGIRNTLTNVKKKGCSESGGDSSNEEDKI